MALKTGIIEKRTWRKSVGKNKIYYDESCYICSFEINTVREKGESCGIEFIDISSGDFDSDGCDFESEMIGEFNGIRTVGVETFRRMYEEMGYKKSVCFTRLPVVRLLVDVGYHIFAHYVRPFLPKKKE